MDPRNRSQHPLDEAIDAVRFDAPSEQEVSESRNRVWVRLQADHAAALAPEAAAPSGCEAFRPQFAAYRAGQVSPARELLIQDHLRECGACRREYESGARPGVLGWMPSPATERPRASWRPRLAWAASFAVVAVLASWVWRDQLFPGNSGQPRATLASLQGEAYLIHAGGQRALQSGETLSEKQWVRTGGASRAMLRLAGGSRIEMNERTELAVTRSSRNTTVYLERGAVIIEAAKQREGHLIVHTEDADVFVTGTVFSVNRGVLGSRVSVAEGSVAVKPWRGDNRALHAGEQYIASSHVAAQPVEDDFAWSANASRHLALLHEISRVKRQWERLRLPELRYDSVLLGQMPPSTVFFAGLPNLGGTLENAWQVFEAQTRQSPVLKEWWTRAGANRRGEPVAEIVRRMKAFCDYLGPEVVFAAVPGPDGQPQFAFLAEVTRPGLPEYLQAEMPAGSGAPPYALVNNTLVFGASAASRETWAAWASRRAPTSFTASGLGRQILAAYRQGAGMLLALDTRAMGKDGPASAPSATGFDNLRYLLIENRSLQQRTDLDSELKAAVTFEGVRHGFASLLASPAAAGSLDYFSANAAVAFSMVASRPEAVYDQILQLAAPGSGLLKDIQEIESRTGMSIRNDLAQALGQDASFGIDGAMLPVPAWKAVIEVRDPVRLQLFVERVVAEMNAELQRNGKKPVALQQESWDGRTLYSLELPESGAAVHYVFADGYWILTSRKNGVARALRIKSQGWRLANSQEFRNRLPLSPGPHYSGLVYVNLTNVAELIGDAAGTAVSPDRVESFRALAANIRPALVCLYADPETIRLQTRTGLLGLTLGQWLGAAGLRELLNATPLGAPGAGAAPENASRRELSHPGSRIESR